MSGEDYVALPCPSCGLYILIYKQDIHCGIFRHGSSRADLEKQINPHESKERCDELAESEEIYGCGAAFYIVNQMTWDADASRAVEQYKLVACDYALAQAPAHDAPK